MPLKLNLGLTKKIGQANYGSIGAACHIEVELDQSLAFDDVDRLRERIQQVYARCRQAVEEELAGQQSRNPEHANGKAVSSGTSDETGLSQNGHRASQKQLDYAGQLAGQI